MQALIVEDELASARNLRQILRDIGNIEILDVLDSIEDTTQWLKRNNAPEVMFLDIHLADGSSFEIFDQVEVNCPIIFTTAFDEHALQAFRVNSVSYLLKPIKDADVRAALRKLDTLKGKNANWPEEWKQIRSIIGREKNYKTHLLVSVRGNKLVPLDVSSISFVRIEDGIVKAGTKDGKFYFPDQTLEELMEQLNPQNFYRANRQYIIAREAVKDIDPWLNQRFAVNLVVPLDEPVIISKAKTGEFKEWLSGNMQIDQ